ncbi:SCO family protein [Flavihumibacter solisilvae]|uniref:SCO family protein n=1 Tax=Flavihumibacter solisilvae TaxID=1349421 RepID=UPI00068E8771|nr:SCO family protein [Flavihumibacter solisilvae]
MNSHIIITLFAMLMLAGCRPYAVETSGLDPLKKSVNATTEIKSKPAAESIFQLADTFQTQDGKPFNLAMLKGKPTVVGMIFTNCTYACSRLTSDIKGIADSLQGQADKVNFLLVSFDSERDHPARLKQFAGEMGLGENWTLLHGSDEAVRSLSVLLNVQYEKSASGNFSHSNMVSVLDKNGVFRFQQEGLFANHTQTISEIKDAIRK